MLQEVDDAPGKRPIIRPYRVDSHNITVERSYYFEIIDSSFGDGTTLDECYPHSMLKLKRPAFDAQTASCRNVCIRLSVSCLACKENPNATFQGLQKRPEPQASSILHHGTPFHS